MRRFGQRSWTMGIERKREYQVYLATDHWKQLRESVLRRDGYRCTRCPSQFYLQAHHKFYRPRFEDSIPDDLVTLCRSCHEREHGLQKESKPIPGVAGRIGKKRWDVHGNRLDKRGRPIKYGKKQKWKKRRRSKNNPTRKWGFNCTRGPNWVNYGNSSN